jgi:hypothetical protein
MTLIALNKKCVFGFILIALMSYGRASDVSVKKFSGTDYSGTYLCRGLDAKEREYTAKMQLEIQFRYSQGSYAAYRLSLDIPGQGSFIGHAASESDRMALHFTKTEKDTTEYGTGIAKMKRNKQGRWTFTNYFYSPEFQNGNMGFETCVREK